jgi:leucine-rich repeat/fibronectin type-III domain-containing protein 5
LPPTWTSSAPVSQKQKRKTGTKPSAEPQSEAVTNVESQNTNRNNSTALQLASCPPDSVTEGPTSQRAHTKPSKFLTVPAEGSRARHRASLSGGLKDSFHYGNSQLSLKRSMSMNAMWT